MVAKYSAGPPFVECGGLENPTIASYDLTIAAMAKLKVGASLVGGPGLDEQIRAAQMCRYLQIHRPLEASCPGYVCENPATGGLPLERLPDKYHSGNEIGTAICLSVLEHVAQPFEAIEVLWEAMKLGGLVIVSVPWEFPHHPSDGEDNWRFSPTGLRHVFRPKFWQVLEAGWRLQISASAGVLDIRSGEPQAIRSAYICARAS